MSTETTGVPVAAEPIGAANVDRRGQELWHRFHQAAFADPSLLDDIPNGVTLVLVPTDDPEVARREVERGLAILGRGKDVYFRHVAPADLPDASAPVPPSS